MRSSPHGRLLQNGGLTKKVDGGVTKRLLSATRADATVRTCWDADRLDLGRVRVHPHPKYLCTDYARRRSTIEWAYRRSRAG